MSYGANITGDCPALLVQPKGRKFSNRQRQVDRREFRKESMQIGMQGKIESRDFRGVCSFCLAGKCLYSGCNRHSWIKQYQPIPNLPLLFLISSPSPLSDRRRAPACLPPQATNSVAEAPLSWALTPLTRVVLYIH